MSFRSHQTRAVGYNETASSISSLCDFNWREIRLRAVPSLPAKKSSEPTALGDNSEKAGGYGYRGSSLNSSPCRNRSILWYVADSNVIEYGARYIES